MYLSSIHIFYSHADWTDEADLQLVNVKAVIIFIYRICFICEKQKKIANQLNDLRKLFILIKGKKNPEETSGNLVSQLRDLNP